jgi:hypothetical protein
MEQYVIIEKLKETINGRKVIAGLFYSYNFDSKFFENYLLPVFLPHVNFSEIEIQNSILWRKYANELPPVTVYCDFHAKSNNAPSLGYTVRAIDIKSKNGIKPRFHPKNSFILLEDETLLIITGSNNLSVGGWCTNVEITSLFEMKSGSYFPYKLKHELWDFIFEIKKINGSHYTDKEKDAEKEIVKFFSQRKHSNETDKQFYSSISGNFLKLFSELVRENNELPFCRIEVFSPYFTTDVKFVEETLSFSKDKIIYVLTPYIATNLTDITKDTYYNFQDVGIVWSGILQDDDKVFRFNHSKIYRLKGEKKMFTIAGSVNYTEAGWNGNKLNGNIESAIVYVEPVSNWKNWLIEYDNPAIQFSVSNDDEASTDQRYDVPDLHFELDWFNKKLFYNNLKQNKFKGVIMLPYKSYEMVVGKRNEIQLNNSQIDTLGENAIIKVHEYVTQREFYFFPVQLNLENKPYSSKLKLNDRELIELWQQVSIKETDKNEISDLLEKFISTRFDNEGELIDKIGLSKGTINTIASHLNALIKLEERLFKVPNKKNEFEKSIELLDYYLFTCNVDTLIGYRNLLKEMLKEIAILPGVVWFLLNLLLFEFYDRTKVAKAYANLKYSKKDLKAKVDKVRTEISEEMKVLKKSIKSGEISENLYKWIINQVRK